MHRFLKFLFLAAVSTIISPLAGAAQFIDQNAPTNNAFMAAFGQDNGQGNNLAQSFQQAASNIVGAGIFLESGVGSTDTVTISLWNNLPNNSGTMLVSASTTGTQGSWADVFWSSVAVTPNTTYYLVFTGNTSLGIAGDTTNQYSRGQVYANAGFGSFPSYDYTFRTYATDVNAVPEPESYAMLLAGLGLMGFIARRRKQRTA